MTTANGVLRSIEKTSVPCPTTGKSRVQLGEASFCMRAPVSSVNGAELIAELAADSLFPPWRRREGDATSARP